MMLRTSSQSCYLRIFLATLAMLLFATLAAYGQSLGDVARENGEKKAADAPPTPPKVITNKTLPKDPDAGPSTAESPTQAQTPPSPASAESSKKAARQRAAEQRAAEQWKQKIMAQENTIANLRLRIDRLKARSEERRV